MFLARVKKRRSFLSFCGRAIGAAFGSIALAELEAKAITNPSVDLEQLIRQTTVRILTGRTSGSGVIVQQQGSVYTVLTCWHVFAFSDRPYLLDPDGRRYSFLAPPGKLGHTDLAIAHFRSTITYPSAPLSSDLPVVGEQVYAAGFPMYYPGTVNNTLALGVKAFHLTQGQVSLFLSQSLAEGYRLGYTNEIEIGMSGGPVFSDRGLLIGINGRLKNRDPDFGVYVFEDGSEPSPALLAQILQASWGIPINPHFCLTVYH